MAGEPAQDPGRVATLELEASLARRGEVYLVIEPWRRELQIKARGIVLDSIRLTGIEILTQRPALARGEPAALELPAIWAISEGPSQDIREIIAPHELRPYAVGGDEPPDPDATPGARPTPTPAPQPPVSYTVAFGNGWDLLVTDTLPGGSPLTRLLDAVKDGWQRLFKPILAGPPLLAVSMDQADARRLHHLLRTKPPVLITAPPV